MDPSLSIVIPAYNAALTLPSVIDRFSPDLWRCTRAVYIVNDGSKDATGAVIDALAEKHRVIRPVQLTRNSGYGAAMRRGLGLCRGDGCDFAGCVHADGQYPPEAILHFALTMAAEETDLMQGSRLAVKGALAGGMPLYKYVAGKILTALENACFGLRMSDYHSGFLIYSRKCLDTVPFDGLSGSFDFDIEMIALAHARGLRVAELPIPTRYAGERSYLNPIGYGLRVLRVLAKYKTGWYHAKADKNG